MSTRFPSFTFAVIGLCICLLCACAREEKAPSPSNQVTLATPQVPFSEMVFLAHREGLFAREGLNMKLILTSSSEEALGLMLAGKADFSAVASVPLMTAIMKGGKPVLLATICRSEMDNALIARGDRGITNEEDLAGKRIGVPFRTGAHFYLYNLLAEAGVPEKNVRIINLSPHEATQALTDGKVDAVVQYLPWHIRSEQAVGSDAIVLAPRLYTTHWIITANREAMQSQPEAASKILNAIQVAKKLAARAPERTLALTAETLALSKEEMAWRRRYYKDHVHLPQSMIISLENEARWYLASNSSSGQSAEPIPNFLDYIDSGPLKKIRPESVRITQ